MKEKTRFIMVSTIFVVCMIVSMAICVRQSKGVLRDGYEKDNRVVAKLIENGIDKSFLRPITVSETISKDYTTKKILGTKTEKEAKKMEETASEYLRSIRDGFGYSMVYAVSDLSKVYYTYNGISKFVDPENDEHDIWYKNFADSGSNYKLDVDTDEAADWSLSVFVNTAVYGDDDTFLGVCGVGVDMTELQKLIERYERIYDVKVDLINEDGLIQVDTDTSRIETDYIRINDLKKYSDGECYYEILDKGNRTITYIENLDWYLIVKNNHSLGSEVYGIILPCVFCFAVGIVLAIAVVVIGKKKEKED